MRPGHTRALALALLGLTFFAAPAHAYVGPGAGFAVVGSLGVLFVTFILAFVALITWPFRTVYRTIRKRLVRTPTDTKRVIILGLDGLDPGLIRRWIREGHLPTFAKLAEEGCFHNLATTFPSMSPVAWSSFATGVDASKHNIFDFLNRDLRSHMPVLSSTNIHGPEKLLRIGKYEFPLSKPAIRFLRRSKSFWQILGEHYVPCHVLRVPITFPPEKVPNGALLSAMCVPDLRGTQGSFTFFTTDRERAAAFEGGTVLHVERQGNVITGEIPGPPNPLTRAHQVMTIPFRVELLDAPAGAAAAGHTVPAGGSASGAGAPAPRARLTIGKEKIELAEHAFSDWVTLTFKVGLGQKVRGIVRFRVMSFAPHFNLYVTPIHLDPESPAMPISSPGFFAQYLARLQGPYATLGLAEDTWALNERVLDEEAFLDFAWKVHAEREQMWFNSLKKNKRGVNVVVFDATDRLQHMFFRYLVPEHPSNRDKDTVRFKDTLLDLYKRSDDVLRRTLEYVRDDHTVLFVLSDHGFKPFMRGVNLNSWFLQNGYMTATNGSVGRYFDGVDWSHTRAYAFGLGGIYINVKDRELHGAVDRGAEYQAIKAELIEKLSGLRDPASGKVGILRVYDGASIYRGPYRSNGPDLVVGYNVGYRASWDGAVGAGNDVIFEDNTKSWSGDHCIDPLTVPGIFLSNRKVKTAYPSIADFAPTLLALFGVKIPEHVDGISLFDESAAARRTSLLDAYFPAGVPEGLRQQVAGQEVGDEA
jgi:predicted AlkP superfamily phosphohydrolase/phosphomutase